VLDVGPVDPPLLCSPANGEPADVGGTGGIDKAADGDAHDGVEAPARAIVEAYIVTIAGDAETLGNVGRGISFLPRISGFELTATCGSGDGERDEGRG